MTNKSDLFAGAGLIHMNTVAISYASINFMISPNNTYFYVSWSSKSSRIREFNSLNGGAL